MAGINLCTCLCVGQEPEPGVPCPVCQGTTPKFLQIGFTDVDLISCGDITQGQPPGIGNVELQPNEFPGPYLLEQGVTAPDFPDGSPCRWVYYTPNSGYFRRVYQNANCGGSQVLNQEQDLLVYVWKTTATQGEVLARLGPTYIFSATFAWSVCADAVSVPNALTVFTGFGQGGPPIYGRGGTANFAPPPPGPGAAPGDGLIDAMGYTLDSARDDLLRPGCCDPPQP